MKVMNAEIAQAFAREWIAAWNARDLERILAFYADDFVLSSPLIAGRTGEASGVLQGKAVISQYWRIGLAAKPSLRFELREVFAGPNTVVICYESIGRHICAEVFIFDAYGQITRSAANHRLA
jgi:ketosteroid isomerase-like protein